MTDQELLNKTFLLLQFTDQVSSRKEFAEKIGYDYSNLSNAFNGKGSYLNSTLFSRIETAFPGAMEKVKNQAAEYTIRVQNQTVMLIPHEARGGSLGDFAEGVMGYQCEKIVTPIRNVDYAVQITGDSMSPEYPSGSTILVKKIDEEMFIEWGRTYLLDTPNGAVVKKIMRTEDPHEIECISINPAYPPFRIKTDHILGWYKVLMCMTAK